jgi:hypothetical protein
MALLEFQSTMHRETRDNGRLGNTPSWMNSLTAHDFFLAGTIISMDLYLEKHRTEANASSVATSPRTTFSDSNSGRSGSVGESYGFTMGMEYSQDDLLRSLEESRDVWTGIRDESIEAYKASEILNVLIGQLKVPAGPAHGNHDEPQYGGANRNGNHGQVDEKQNAAMTLGLLSSGGKSPNAGISSQQQQPQHQRAPGNIFDNPNSIEALLQPTGASSNSGGSIFDTPNATNGPIPFFGMFGASSVPDDGGGMNLDWVSGLIPHQKDQRSIANPLHPQQDAFDSYIQSSNLTLDPANTLWSSTSPIMNASPFPTNIAPPTSSSSTTTTTTTTTKPATTTSELAPTNTNTNLSSTFYPPATTIPLDPAIDPASSAAAAQVFMGVASSPPLPQQQQPLGGPVPAWKWKGLN